MSTYPSKDIERAACTAAGEDVPPRALVRAVAPLSPADDAGFEPDCSVTSVDGRPVRDLIDWRWLASDDVIELGYIDLDGEAGVVELEREPGEDWGLEFEGVVFDGVRQCRNACTFCFMRQLPGDVRPSLTLRDDDFRLSFLSGTFVTFTNLSAADEARILEQRISPLRVSLHASNPEVRRRIIGRHAAHGLDALDRLLAAGIEFHAQIVLMPDENDGDFGMFEDGVGIIRSFVDDWGQAAAAGLPARAADALRAAGIRARYVVGCATRHFLGPLVAASPLAGVLGPLYVKNEFFGGNVDVTGLLCGCDIAAAVRGAARQDDETRTLFLLPSVIFNDDSVTLDDMSLEDMEKDAGAPLAVVSCNASDFLREIVDLAGRESPAPDRTNL